MPDQRLNFFRPNVVSDRLATDQIHDLVRETAAILKTSPPPDTFLGRKTQEAISKRG
jgi:hypothetical protein